MLISIFISLLTSNLTIESESPHSRKPEGATYSTRAPPTLPYPITRQEEGEEWQNPLQNTDSFLCRIISSSSCAVRPLKEIPPPSIGFLFLCFSNIIWTNFYYIFPLFFWNFKSSRQIIPWPISHPLSCYLNTTVAVAAAQEEPFTNGNLSGSPLKSERKY